MLQNAQATRSILKSFADYGSPSDRRYCASGVGYYTVGVFCRRVLHPYQNSINSETQNPFWRPSCLSVSEDHQITSTFVVGPGLWVTGQTRDDCKRPSVRDREPAGRRSIHHSPARRRYRIEHQLCCFVVYLGHYNRVLYRFDQLGWTTYVLHTSANLHFGTSQK